MLIESGQSVCLAACLLALLRGREESARDAMLWWGAAAMSPYLCLCSGTTPPEMPSPRPPTTALWVSCSSSGCFSSGWSPSDDVSLGSQKSTDNNPLVCCSDPLAFQQYGFLLRWTQTSERSFGYLPYGPAGVSDYSVICSHVFFVDLLWNPLSVLRLEVKFHLAE